MRMISEDRKDTIYRGLFENGSDVSSVAKTPNSKLLKIIF